MEPLHIKIEHYIEKHLELSIKEKSSSSAKMNGKWRYHNWQSDINDHIWSIYFNNFKVYSYARYELNLESIEKFRFIGLECGEVILTNDNLDIAFPFIKELIERDKLIKSLLIKSKDEIRKFNDGDVSFIRDYKLLLLDI